MRSLESASSSWEELKRYTTSWGDVKAAARLEGHSSPIASASLRSSCWKAFLLFESLDTATWPRILASSRSAYDSLRMHFLSRLENPDLGSDSDGLTETSGDEALRAEIQQDVDRCMPENLYFRQPEARRMLLDILFVYSKLNPDVGYRQGMHELLAPVLWVVERDAIDLGLSSKTLGEDAVVRAIFDAEQIEHDSFALFSKIMQSAKNFYEQTTHASTENPIVMRSRRICTDYLSQVDPELAQHLENIDIVPQVFLMRWIRLLFGREFPFDDVLLIWDVVFAEDPSLELVDHICVAMLLRIRWELLDADYNAALMILLRYPEPDKVNVPQTFVTDALYLRDQMNVEAGGYLVLKYTGQPILSTGRPRTPPALQRNITAFSGAAGERPRMQRNLESILQSTAKNIYSRGGQAVRTAVDEVHKRASEIRETQTPRPPPRGYGPLYHRIKANEKRNEDLSKLLDGALADLWGYQKLAADANAQQEGTTTVSAPDVEQLSVAIAKVQFVQVYLSDSSLALPSSEAQAEPQRDEARDTRPNVENATRGHVTAASQGTSEPQPSLAATPTAGSSTEPPSSLLADPSSFEDFDPIDPAPETAPNGASATEQGAPNAAEDVSIPNDQLTPKVAEQQAEIRGLSPRPPLAESSFSWMLGQENAPQKPALSAEKDKDASLFGEDPGVTTVIPKHEKRKGASARKQRPASSRAADVDVLR